MVSNASDDLPEPLSPVMTVKVLRGISTEMFFKLCWRAPRTVMLLIAMDLINLVCKTEHKSNKTSGKPLLEAPEGERTALLRILSSGTRHGQFDGQARTKHSGFNLMTSVICGSYDQRA